MDKRSAKGSIVERDSLMITQWLSGSSFPWRLLDKIEEIRWIISKLELIISHIPRSVNKKADKLAKLGSRLGYMRKLFLNLGMVSEGEIEV